MPERSDVLEPVVSVVVTTRNRAHLLPRLFDALAAQQDAGPFEIVVVDDCSTDGTSEVVKAAAATAPITIRLIRREEPGGAGAGRNTGWRAARAPLIVFTDDDCVPQPGWLASLVRGLGENDVVQGRTQYPEGEDPGWGPFATFVWVDQITWHFEACNIGYRREMLERLDGFDERIPGRVFGEDVDLGWRALEAGATVSFAPDAFVIHEMRHTGRRYRDLAEGIRHGLRWRRIGRIVREHPAYAERRLHRGLFLDPIHARVLAALAGLAVAATGPTKPLRLGVAVAAMVPWVRYRLRIEEFPYPGWKAPPLFALAFVVDAVEVLVTVGSALRYRAPIL